MVQNADIKVVFQQNKNEIPVQKIRLFFKDVFNNDVQIDLRPGEFVYSQTSYISNSLRIYSKKGLIIIKEEKKPDFLEYYVGYGQNEYLHKFEKEDEKIDLSKEIKEQSKVGLETKETALDKALKQIKDYSEKKKKPAKSKSRKGPGRPKKRGPKKGSKRQSKE
jgi:hypothetical protein